MGVKRNPTGPLTTSTLRRVNEVIFWAPTRPPEILPRDDDVVYLIRSHDRLDNIAAEQLLDEQLGWVILHRNDLRLAPNDLVPGHRIFIPTRASLQARGIVK
jgi:hypothetical protein